MKLSLPVYPGLVLFVSCFLPAFVVSLFPRVARKNVCCRKFWLEKINKGTGQNGFSNFVKSEGKIIEDYHLLMTINLTKQQ